MTSSVSVANAVVTGGFPRPGGVVEEEQAIVASWTTRSLRVDVRAFVDACALLHYSEHSAMVALLGFRAVEAGLADPTQFRTGSDFEVRCLSAVERLRPVLGPLSVRLDAVRPLELDAVAPALIDVPPTVILGTDEPDRQFDLICWNQANAIAEDVQRPYLAAVRISGLGLHDPADRFGLVGPMTALRVRYEDEPERRAETAARIVEVLDRFRAAAPWPLDG